MTLVSDWEQWKLSHAYRRIGSGTTPTAGESRYYSDNNGTPWITTAELREAYIERTAHRVTSEAFEVFPALRIYQPRSVFIAMYGATIGRLGMNIIPAACNQACCVFEQSNVFENRYLYYWLWHRRSDLVALSVGGGQPNLSQDDLRREIALCPPLDIQGRIVAFLDAKIAQIDTLIAKKLTLIERLTEKRQAIITRAVTRGLNPAAPMKESGIDWLGQIPAHWEVRRLDRLNDGRRPICYGIVLPGPHFEGGVPIIKGGDVRPERLKRELLSCTDPEIDAANPRARVVAGDLVYTIRGSFGDVEIVTKEVEGCNLTQDTARISPLSNIDRHWLVMALKSNVVRGNLAAGSLGATIKGINIFDLRRALLPTPPLEEQGAIARYLANEAAHLDAARHRVERSVDLLAEYRSALITAAVTGRMGGLWR